MRVHKLQPTVTRIAKCSAERKQTAAKNLSKVALNNIKASVVMESLKNEAAKSLQATGVARPVNRDIDFLFMGFAC